MPGTARRITVDGNEAVARVAHLGHEVIAIYPITPASPMGELADAIKAIMCGADAVQVVSLLLRHGPESLTELCRGVQQWLEEHEYESLEQARGSLDLHRTPDPAAYSRGNYLHILQSWRGYLPPRA